MPVKTCVYAIAKNETKFIDTFLESCKESDYIVIADTGSTDDTLEKLNAAKEEYPNLIIHQIHIRPWRFDMARDAVLAICPADAEVMLSIDLDEKLIQGWYQEIQDKWTPGTTRAWYDYIWQFRIEDGKEVPNVQFRTNKIHGRWGYHWVCPVHEVVERYDADSPEVAINTNILLEHHADESKSRGQYLPGLEMSVRERPHDARTVLYCARERGFHGNFAGEAELLNKFLQMPGTWNAERSYAYTLLGTHCVDLQERLSNFAQAVTEDPQNIAAYYHLCDEYSHSGQWPLVLATAARAIEGPTQRYYFTNPKATREYFFIQAALAAYKLGDLPKAAKITSQGLAEYPDSRLMQANLPWYTGEKTIPANPV